MPYIKIPTEAEATGAIAERFEANRRRVGRLYEIIRLHGPEPRVLDGMLALYTATVTTPRAPLPRQTREMIAVVVSRANDCFY